MENATLNDFLTLLGVQKMPKFLGIRNYTNLKGDVSNYVIITGASHENAKKADIETLKAKISAMTPETNGLEYIAATALLDAFIKPNEARSKGQINAFTWLDNGTVKVHNETGVFYVWGYCIQKKKLISGPKKPDTRSDLTKAKDAIRKTLKTGRYTQFPICYGDTFHVAGHRVTVTPAVKVPATV